MVGAGGSSGWGRVSQLFSKSEPIGGTAWTPPASASAPGGILPRGPWEVRGLRRPASASHPGVQHKRGSHSGCTASSGCEHKQWRSLVAHRWRTSPLAPLPALGTPVSKAQAGSGKPGQSMGATSVFTTSVLTPTWLGLIWWGGVFWGSHPEKVAKDPFV